MLGYTHGEFVGKKLWEIGPFKDISASRSAFSELQTKGVIRYEDLPLETKDGRRINVEFVSNVYPVDGTQVVQCNVRDITERVQAEAALKISETHHRSVFDGAVHGIYRGTLVVLFLDVNPALVAMLGYSSTEEVLNLSVSQDVFAEPEEGLRLLHKWQVTAEIEEEVEWKRRGGRVVTERVRGRGLGKGEQRAAWVEAVARDATRRGGLGEEVWPAEEIE